MKLQMYAVRDRATDQYGNPMFLVNHGQAIRSFTDEVNGTDKDSMIKKHPGDFDLYHLGVYETETGLFETLQRPKQIAIGKDLVLTNGAGS